MAVSVVEPGLRRTEDQHGVTPTAIFSSSGSPIEPCVCPRVRLYVCLCVVVWESYVTSLNTYDCPFIRASDPFMSTNWYDNRWTRPRTHRSRRGCSGSCGCVVACCRCGRQILLNTWLVESVRRDAQSLQGAFALDLRLDLVHLRLYGVFQLREVV